MENVAVPQVKFGEWISEGWRMFIEQWKAWVLNSVVFFAIAYLPMTIFFIIFYVSVLTASTRYSSYPRRSAPPDLFPFSVIFFLLMAVMIIFTMVASAFLLGGMYRSALKQLRGGMIEIRDLFSGRQDFLPILGYHFLAALLIIVGLMLCIIPGYIVMGALFFSLPLIIDRRLGVIQAMQTSYELTKKNLLMFTLFAFVVTLLASAGSYACYIGLLVTIPLQYTITAVAYRDCFGVEGARRFVSNATPSPGGYGQSIDNIYQPPPPYGQGGYNPQNFTPPAPPNYPAQGFDPPPMPPNFAPLPPPASPNPAPPSGSGTQPVNMEQMPKPTAPENQGTGSISCANCGTLLPASAAFCPRCGTRTKP